MNKLSRNIAYGTNSQEIYEKLCVEFGWDKGQIDNFGFRRPLYARNADAERIRDVWFICHSNLSDNPSSPNKNHTNKIDGDIIKEYYKLSHKDIYPLNDRIVFAKSQDGQYVFLGIFRPKSPHSKEPNRIFYKINDEFSI